MVQNFGKEFFISFSNQPCDDYTTITRLGIFFPQQMTIYVFINIYVYMCSLEYYSAIKTNELLIDFKNLMSSFLGMHLKMSIPKDYILYDSMDIMGLK